MVTTATLGLDRMEISWKLEDKQPEDVDAEEWIGKKGYAAKGKKCAAKGEVKSVRFIEPLVKEDDKRPKEGAEEPAPIELEMPDGSDLGTDALTDLPDDDMTFEEPTLF